MNYSKKHPKSNNREKNLPDTLVITPTLGSRPTLERTVESVRTIGGSRVKHVIVAPSKAVAEIKKKYPYLTVLSEPTSCKGLYQALNHGIKQYAHDFEYLTYINDDDFWTYGFTSLFEEADSHRDVDIVYGRVTFVDAGGKLMGEQTSSPRYKDFATLLQKNIILFTQQATLTRSKLFMQLGGFDESYKLVADTRFWLAAVQANARMKYVNKLCAGYTIQAGQLSANQTLQRQEHKRLLLEGGKTGKLRTIVDPLLFRLRNADIYMKRLLKNRNFHIVKWQ